MNFLLLFATIGMSFAGLQKMDSYKLTGSKVELLELRTENQKVFQLANGNYEYMIYSNPIHYFNGEKMVEINNADSLSSNSLVNIRNFDKNDLNYFYSTNKKFENRHIYENIVFEKNEKEDNFRNNNARYTQVNNEYIVTSDEYYLFPDNKSIDYDGSNTIITSEYNTKETLDNSISYPLSLVNESIILDNDNPVIRDKYITKGLDGATESNVLLAGTDVFQIIDQNNNLVKPNYVTVIEIDFPDINPNYLISAKIGISKNSTTSNNIRNPNITLNKVVSNINYDNFEGTTNYNKSQLNTGIGSASSYLFDITESVVSSIEDDSKLLLTIESNSTGYASFYSTEANHINSPYISFEVTSNSLGGTLYGDAPNYEEVNSQNVNCFGYALLVNQWVSMNLTSRDYEDVYNEIQSIVQMYGYGIREIDSYNTDIYLNERRIAFRYSPLDLNSWHFVLQNSDGCWSAKLGNGNCGKYPITMNPDSESMWDMYSQLQNKNTYYFALS